MNRRRLTFFALLATVIGLPLLAWWLFFGQKESPYPFKLSDRIAWLEVEDREDGRIVVFTNDDGSEIHYSAEDFLDEVAEAKGDGSTKPPILVRKTLNITSYTGIFWVSIGFLGQALFTGRMLIQWITSERQKKSVVPVSFWWLSLAGATMNTIYFIWRVDAVGILGQSTGWFVYLRNLWLIYSPGEDPDETEKKESSNDSSS